MAELWGRVRQKFGFMSDQSTYEMPEDDSPLMVNGDTPRRVMRTLSYRERLTVSPYKKFIKYGKFPFKLTFSLLVVIFASTYTIARNLQFSDFSAASTESIRHLLRDAEVKTEFTVHELCTELDTVLNSYFNFPNVSLDAYSVNTSVPVWVDTHTQKNFMHFVVSPHNVTESFEPLCSDVRLLQDVDRIALTYHFYITQRGGYIAEVNVAWRADALYDMTVSGGIAQYEIALYLKLRSWSNSTLTALNGVVAALAFISLVLTLKSFFKAWSVYTAVRTRLRIPSQAPGQLMWGDLTFEDKLAFFNLWNVVSVCADVLLILGACLTFKWQTGSATFARNRLEAEVVCRALGLFLAWFALVKYMEWRPELYMLVNAVKASIVKVFLFVITVAPLYVGYMFVGMIAFADKNEYFGNLSRSSTTLFALLNGDSIFMVFEDLQERSDPGYRTFVQFYLYSFCIIFITTVLNVFIFLIEAGYDLAHDASFGRHKRKFVLDNVRLKEIIDAAYLRETTGMRGQQLSVVEENQEPMPEDAEDFSTYDLPPPRNVCSCRCSCGAQTGRLNQRLSQQMTELEEEFLQKLRELRELAESEH